MRRPPASLAVFALVALAAPAPARAEGADSTADYVLTARLDADRHRVEGTEHAVLTNRSTRAIDRVTFHLYLRAFENDATLWLRESGGELRGATMTDWGTIDVTSIQVEGRDVLAESRTDETLLHVPLPHPVPPGGSVALDLAFVARLPSAFARTGWAHRFHMVAQWFPKLARLGPDGRFEARPFHATHEFDEDFGRYDVTLDVPAGWIVGATGEQATTEERGDRRLVVYRAHDVHDFAWTASPDFVEQTVRAGPVRIRSLSYPGQGAAVARQLDAVRKSLARFGRWLGPYPYPVLTVVSPPDDASGAGGMEYPTLITTGSRWPAPSGLRFTEEVAVHELGHQWFYGLLASNEPDAAWLDEGLNTYATGQVMEALYGRDGTTIDRFGVRLGYAAISRLARAVGGTREPLAQRSADYASFGAYGAHVYYGTDLLLRTVAGRVGAARLHAALGRYARAYRFRHPTTEDLLAVLEQDLGHEVVRDLVRPVVHGAPRLDFAIREVVVEPVRRTAGLLGTGGKRTRVDVGEEVTPPRWRTSVLVSREGEIVTPVTLAIRFEDGRTTRQGWDGRAHHRRFELVGPSPATLARLDPGLRVPLDADLTNNARAASGHRGSTAHLWSRLLYVAQTLLQVLGP